MSQTLEKPRYGDASWMHIVDTMTAAADDGLGGDYSAARAHAHLEMHMRECERNRREDIQRQIEQQAEVRAAMAAIHDRLNSMHRTFEERMRFEGEERKAEKEDLKKELSSLGNRMWAAGAALIAGLAVLAFHFFTKGVHL